MTIARSHLIDPARPGAYHLISRCVRRSFLLGEGADHRRDWIRDAVREQASVFAIDVHAYAIMHNHFHLVVAVHPERAERWTPGEVVARWTRLFPLRDDRGEILPPDPAHQAARTKDRHLFPPRKCLS
jgi:putative transposase